MKEGKHAKEQEKEIDKISEEMPKRKDSFLFWNLLFGYFYYLEIETDFKHCDPNFNKPGLVL